MESYLCICISFYFFVISLSWPSYVCYFNWLMQTLRITESFRLDIDLKFVVFVFPKVSSVPPRLPPSRWVWLCAWYILQDPGCHVFWFAFWFSNNCSWYHFIMESYLHAICVDFTVRDMLWILSACHSYWFVLYINLTVRGVSCWMNHICMMCFLLLFIMHGIIWNPTCMPCVLSFSFMVAFWILAASYLYCFYCAYQDKSHCFIYLYCTQCLMELFLNAICIVCVGFIEHDHMHWLHFSDCTSFPVHDIILNPLRRRHGFMIMLQKQTSTISSAFNYMKSFKWKADPSSFPEIIRKRT